MEEIPVLDSEEPQGELSVQPPLWGIIVAIGGFLALRTVFGPFTPYNMMSVTLPFDLLEMFKPVSDIFAEQAELNGRK